MQLIKIRLSREENLSYYNANEIEIDIEEYLKGVVPSEIGNADAEAAKAQSVVARTFSLYKYLHNGSITDKSSVDQAFRASRFSSAYQQAHLAVAATKGEVLYFDGKLISNANFSAANGGKIYSSEEVWGGARPYLISKEDPYDFARSQGKKNGHGVGMSQLGAKEMAARGFTYKQILDFYYPGTTIHKEGDVVPVANIIDTVKQWVLSKKGCGYIWGATGQKLTESALNALIKQYPDHVTYAAGSKWLGKYVYDCASFVRLAMKQAGISMVSGASSQWKKTKWAQSGTIDTLPKDKICCLYRESPSANPMQHTGIYLGDGTTMDARGTSSGVIFSNLSAYKWTHWGIPEGLYDGNTTTVEPEVYEVLYEAKVIASSGSTVRMRSSKSTTSSVLANIPIGTVVSVLEDQDGWDQLMYDGMTGYMQDKFLDKVSNEATPTNKSWYVKVQCGSEEDARAIVAAVQKLASATAVNE